ncbi:hypothetical protein FNI15_22740 [Salmonella enterica subsp. salamae]|uniref:Uncharacterized protein n=1 Tax=Salmonella enterica subsp. salamae TaxID=59202 RepID=A0A5Y2S799_SALER|nr:hypothetical protein [Salmonella enterica subsp. salamae]ECG8596863.1 hypothetical protein [Salmonella enterica subsp. salamae]ECJ2314622.1 hypothetical protein [Salmonella enterica subsp. salamae]EDN4182504.1 hypothetical protein [Salmonella enterica subsp. salamae]
MKYYKITILMLLFFCDYSYSMAFKVTPSDNIDGIMYFTLHIDGVNKFRDIDVALEGNSKNVTIRQYYNFSCNWGEGYGIRLSMDSATTEGGGGFDNIYVVDNQLNIVFAKSYSRMRNKWTDPVNLNSAVCNRMSNGIKKDPLTNKDYVVDFESIEHGPFYLKGIDNIAIKYIRDDFLKLIRDDINGEVVIDSIKNNDNKAPFVCTVFFMKIKSKMNIVSLISWGKMTDGDDYYKVYAYIYDKNGIVHTNEILNEDPNLSGYDSAKEPFKYKSSSSIKKYIIKNYGF